jgi:RNA polymerase sigma factor (sigma-70 family)
MLVEQDWEDIFHDSCITLMSKVKSGSCEATREGGIFCYLVEIGKGTAMNLMRKKRQHDAKQQDAIANNLHRQDGDFDVTVEEKQNEQDAFLDRVFDSIPGDCKLLLKAFYWDRKPMDEISSMMGLRNADTAKTKKNRCMNKFKEIASMLLESDEFAEEVVRASVERACLLTRYSLRKSVFCCFIFTNPPGISKPEVFEKNLLNQFSSAFISSWSRISTLT